MGATERGEGKVRQSNAAVNHKTYLRRKYVHGFHSIGSRAELFLQVKHKLHIRISMGKKRICALTLICSLSGCVESKSCREEVRRLHFEREKAGNEVPFMQLLSGEIEKLVQLGYEECTL
jgi:hypothetical protein